MDAGFFRGTNSEQDRRFGDKNQKLLKTLKFADVLKTKVDLNKVKVDVLRPWIAQRMVEIAGVDDDVVAGYASEMLGKERYPDPKMMQINLTGFMTAKFARKFMEELWTLLISAQSNDRGLPQAILDEQKAQENQPNTGVSAGKRLDVEQAKQRSPPVNNKPATDADGGDLRVDTDRMLETKAEHANVGVGKVSASNNNSIPSAATDLTSKSNQQNVVNEAAISAADVANSSPMTAVLAVVKKVEKQSLAKMVEKLQKVPTSAKLSGLPGRPKFGRNILSERENNRYHRRRSSYSSSRSSSRSSSSRSRSPPRRRRYSGGRRRRSPTPSRSPIDFRLRRGSRDRHGQPRQRPSRADVEGEDARVIAQRYGRNRDRGDRSARNTYADTDKSRREIDRRRSPRESRPHRDRRSPASSRSSSSRRSSTDRHRRSVVDQRTEQPAVGSRRSPARREASRNKADRDADKRNASIDSFGRPRRKDKATRASPPVVKKSVQDSKARESDADAGGKSERVGRNNNDKLKSRESKLRDKSPMRTTDVPPRRSSSRSRSGSRGEKGATRRHVDADAKKETSDLIDDDKSKSRKGRLNEKSAVRSIVVATRRSSSRSRSRSRDKKRATRHTAATDAGVKNERSGRSDDDKSKSRAGKLRDKSPVRSTVVAPRRNLSGSRSRSRGNDRAAHHRRRDVNKKDAGGSDGRRRGSEKELRKLPAVHRDSSERQSSRGKDRVKNVPKPSSSPISSSRRKKQSRSQDRSEPDEQNDRLSEARDHRKPAKVGRVDDGKRNDNERLKKSSKRRERSSESLIGAKSRRQKSSPSPPARKTKDRIVGDKAMRDADNKSSRRRKSSVEDESRSASHRKTVSDIRGRSKVDDRQERNRKASSGANKDKAREQDETVSSSITAASAKRRRRQDSEFDGKHHGHRHDYRHRRSSSSSSSKGKGNTSRSKKPIGANGRSGEVKRNQATSVSSAVDESSWADEAEKFLKGELGASSSSQKASTAASPRQPLPGSLVHSGGETAHANSSSIIFSKKPEQSSSPRTPEHSPPMPRTPPTSPPPFLLMQANQKQHNARADVLDPSDDMFTSQALSSLSNEADEQERHQRKQQQQLHSSFVTPSPTKMFASSSAVFSEVSGHSSNDRYRSRVKPVATTPTSVNASGGTSDDKYRSSRQGSRNTVQSPGVGRKLSPTTSSATTSRMSSAMKSQLESRRSSSRLSSTNDEADNESVDGDAKSGGGKNSADTDEVIVDGRELSRSRSGSHNSLEELKKQEWYQQRLKQGEDKQRERGERRQRRLDRKLERAAAKQEHKQQKRKTLKNDASEEEMHSENISSKV